MSGETRAGVYGSRMATRGKSAEDSGGSGDGGRPMERLGAALSPCGEVDRPGGLSHLAPSVRDFQKASAVRSFSGAPKPALWMASARSRSELRSEEHTSELQSLRH